MADNVTAEAVVAGGSVFRTDEDVGGGGHVPYNKLMYGADGTFTIASNTAPFPVELKDVASTVVADIAAIKTADQLIDNTIVVDDAAFTPATTSVNMAGFEFDDTAPDSVNEGDAGAARMSARREVYVQLRDAAGNERGVNVDAGGAIGIHDNANSLTVDGVAAHDAAMSGSPVALAARATDSVEGLTQVAAADASYVTSDRNGCLVTRPHTTLAEILVERISNTDGASTAFATFGVGGAGIHNYVTTIIVHNSHASTNGFVDLRDGAAGAVLMTIPVPAGGGAVINLDVPLKQTTANTALAYDVSAAITTVYISLVGFQAKAA